MESPGVDIGTLLKEQRIKLGYSLADAAERTRIRKVYLENIEQNNFSALPGAAYVRGFIDVYSRFLNLNSKQRLDSLASVDSATTGQSETSPVAEKIDEKFLATSEDRGRRKSLWILLIIIIVALLLYLASGYFFEDRLPSAENGGRAPQVEVAPAEQTAVSEETQITTDSVARAVVSGAEQSQTDAVDSRVEQATREPLPAIPAEGASLRMLAIADGSLIIKVDNRKPHEYPLHDGLDLTWKVKGEVGVELSQVDLARFWLDGQEIDISNLKEFVLQPPEE